ncbi:hypothetical protein KPH14_005040 [Odynerus spinipes]|uniref:Uncharacterized protein n=1 Tax=Odynerus spinipes TaxID=1348599 RepID=A0AAD9RNK0_9HYME|nr:hypothetical protein KPH14_005040 [Odynerus spinipes]
MHLSFVNTTVSIHKQRSTIRSFFRFKFANCADCSSVTYAFYVPLGSLYTLTPLKGLSMEVKIHRTTPFWSWDLEYSFGACSVS